MKLISAVQARMISEDANVAKYKEELEEIFKLIENKAREGGNSILLSEQKYIKAIHNNRQLFQEGGYQVNYYGYALSVSSCYTISW